MYKYKVVYCIRHVRLLSATAIIMTKTTTNVPVENSVDTVLMCFLDMDLGYITVKELGSDLLSSLSGLCEQCYLQTNVCT